MIYRILLLISLLTSYDYSHGQLITGKILNTNDETPMTGCVLASNRQDLGMVDKEGLFSINKTDNMKELVFKFIGMNSFKINIDQITKDTDLGTLFMFETPSFYYLKKGIATETYRNGQTRFFLNVKKSFAHGTYTEYYENGKTKIQGQYSKHSPIGLWTYHRKNEEIVKIEFEEEGFYRTR